ncbi:hypothetical protein JCM16303_005987 [Sporobolomyces ruberrimus]
MPRNRLSGAQPTFSTLGKAKGSKTGTKRAKPGQRMRRMDAFPEEGGNRLIDSEEEDDDNEDGRAQKKIRATSAAAKKARARAADKRASGPRTRPCASPLENDETDLFEVSSVSSHSSDEEPDSDEPDRESSKVSRYREKVREEKKKRGKGKGKNGPGGGGGNLDTDEIRRKRAEAAEKRLEKAKEIVIDGTDTEEEKEFQARQEKEKRDREGVEKAKGKGKEVAVQKTIVATKGKKKSTTKASEGVRLGGPTNEEELAALEKELGDMPPVLRLKHLKEAAKKLNVKAPSQPQASTSRQTLEAPGPRVSRRQQNQLFLDSDPEASSDGSLVDPSELGTNTSREARRRRTQGNEKTQSTTRRFSIDTGGSGSGSAARFTIGSGGGGERGKSTSDIFKKKLSKKQRLRARSGSESEEDVSFAAPELPDFIEPRKDLQRRKNRDLSDPPTDAFSSSGGSDEDSDEAGTREKGGGRRKKGENSTLDEWDKIEREMKKRKRVYREERRPGYSNPRKN